MLRLTLALVLLTSYVSCDPNYKLNTPIRPISYQLYLKPYFETGDDREFTFDGQVNIMFTTTESTRQIKFHSEDLEFTAENVTLLNNGATIPLDSTNPLAWNTDYDFAYLNLQNNLTVGVEYELKIVYEGPVRDDLTGFYRNYYMEQGVKKWLGATQMEPTHARKVFPSFDEPELKAVFNIIIDRPASYQPSLANTKIQETVNMSNDYVRETFYPTPRMSTYLVAFLVSEFQAAQYYVNPSNNRELGVFTRPEAASQSNYTFDFSKRVVEALSEYFGIDYYSTNSQLKLDHVALINFRAGAMENWGLVTYREASLLYVPEVSTPYYKYRVAQIIAHETTHMWFGNLVTCHWWSNTWLNEGFANYFQDYITAMIEPEIRSDDLLVTSSVYAALDADESPSSPPITNDNVYTPDEISAHFGTVTYQKAGSVIRMMHHLIGDAAFKFGLNVYLTSNAFQSGYPNLLYSALEEGVNTTNSLAAYNGATIADVMSSWVSQAGHPVLMVEVNYETNSVTLTQKRFYINGSHSSDETYMIPITYTTEVFPNFDNTKPVFVMEGKTQVVTITENISQNSWIIFNVQETGFYRVHYDSNALKIITAALKTEDHGRIHYLNRAKIVNDMFAFFFSEHVTFSVLHETLEFLTVEDNFNVWHAAIKGLTKLRNMYMGSDALADIDAYALSLMENIIASLGYEERSTDSFETLRNRMQVLEFACNLGHSGCLQSAAANFRNLVDNGVEIPPSLRPISYCAGLRLGTGSDYDFMWNRMRTTNVANEARTIGGILGCSTDPTSLNKFLVSMQEENSPILSQDLTVPLSGVLGNYSHVQLVITSLDQNLALWKSIYPSMNTVYTAIAGALRTDAELDMFESWLTSCQDCGDVQGGLNTLSSVRATTQWAQTHKAQLSSIRSSAAAIPSSVALLTICIATLMNLS